MKILPLLLLLLLLGVSFYLVLGRGAQESVTQQLLSRQQIIARAEKSNIITFFERFGDGVATLAQLKSIESRDKDTTYDLDLFIEQRKDTGIIGGVILTDKNGIVRFNSNVLGTRDVGDSLADRNFFSWASSGAKKGEYYISRPVISRLGASVGQNIIVVASPVYRNGKFSGVLAASVKLQPLVERFFGMMKVSDQTRVYLVNEGGDLIYSNADPEVLGDQILHDRIEKALSSNEEGQFQTDKYLVAYSPINLGVQKWLLIISSPAQEIAEQTKPFYIHQAVVFVATAFTILLFGVAAGRKNQV